MWHSMLQRLDLETQLAQNDEQQHLCEPEDVPQIEFGTELLATDLKQIAF